ncbi:HU family DNA-binding protein [Viscerimonas tarda]
MDERDLLKNVKERSVDLYGLSDEKLRELLNATIYAIDKGLEAGDIVEIEDFGVFSRRKQGPVSVSFFRPSERLSERINRKR